MCLGLRQGRRAIAAILRNAFALTSWHVRFMKKPSEPTTKPATKEERLAEALRQNLKRRKAQNRGRKAEAKAQDAQDKSGKEEGGERR